MNVSPELVERITALVIESLSGTEALSASSVLVASKDSAWLAAAGVHGASLDSYEGNIEPFCAVVVDELSCARLADMALGRDSSALPCAVTRALLAGVPVYVSAECLPHRAYHSTANPQFYAMFEGYVSRLEQFGVHVMDRAQIAAELGMHAGPARRASIVGTACMPSVASASAAAASAAPAAAATSVVAACTDVDGLLSASKAEDLARTNTRELVLSPGTVVTPLARDILRDNGIAIRIVEGA